MLRISAERRRFLITLCVIERSTWLLRRNSDRGGLTRGGNQVGGEGVAKLLAQVPLECGLTQPCDVEHDDARPGGATLDRAEGLNPPALPTRRPDPPDRQAEAVIA